MPLSDVKTNHAQFRLMSVQVVCPAPKKAKFSALTTLVRTASFNAKFLTNVRLEFCVQTNRADRLNLCVQDPLLAWKDTPYA